MKSSRGLGLVCAGALLAAVGCGGGDSDDEGIGAEPFDDAGVSNSLDAGWAGAGGGIEDAGLDDADPGPDPDPDPDPDPTPTPDSGAPNAAFEVEMVFTTANIGRTYGTKADVQKAFDKVANVVGGKSGPKFVGWQEIGEADPCGDTCEISALKAAFPHVGWLGDGATQTVKVPISSKGANDQISTHAKFASPGWAGVSPTRYVVVSFHASRNLSVVNTHFIAGAWSCKSEVAKRKDYWKQAWQVLKAEVSAEVDKGRNVVVTGDLNRPRAANDCNPAWKPTSLHPRAVDVGGTNIDYVFAVPALGYHFVVSKKGSIDLTIDSHNAHWVTGRFLSQ